MKNGRKIFFSAEINFFINKRKVKKLFFPCASASGDENFFFMFIIIDDLFSISANDVR